MALLEKGSISIKLFVTLEEALSEINSNFDTKTKFSDFLDEFLFEKFLPPKKIEQIRFNPNKPKGEDKTVIIIYRESDGDTCYFIFEVDINNKWYCSSRGKKKNPTAISEITVYLNLPIDKIRL